MANQKSSWIKKVARKANLKTRHQRLKLRKIPSADQCREVWPGLFPLMLPA